MKKKTAPLKKVKPPSPTEKEPFATQYSVAVNFECAVERHDRKAFQEAGHFVGDTIRPQLADGTIDFRAKPDKPGADVWFLTLRFPNHPEQQILRVGGDTLERAKATMASAILCDYFALWTRGQVQNFDYGAFNKLQAERNAMADFIRATHGDDKLAALVGAVQTGGADVR